MQENDVIRAWKDEEYRSRLTEGEARSLPQNPAGLMELTDDDLLMTSGGTTTPCASVAIGASMFITNLASCWIRNNSCPSGE